MMDRAQHILIVEDDAALAAMVADFLRQQMYSVSIEGRGDTAVDRIKAVNPDAVVLDINLPGMNGFEVCRAVRPDYTGTVIMLTARGEEVDEVLGLNAGADDYMAKPVRPRALLARLQVHLQRTASPEHVHSNPIQVGGLIVDPARRSVELNAKPIELTTAEFDLLLYLAENAGRSVSRNEIYQRIHETRYDGLDRSIDLRISRLRKKIGDDPAKPTRIKSVRGVGYILVAE